jgi:hypothetical protein
MKGQKKRQYETYTKLTKKFPPIFIQGFGDTVAQNFTQNRIYQLLRPKALECL